MHASNYEASIVCNGLGCMTSGGVKRIQVLSANVNALKYIN